MASRSFTRAVTAAALLLAGAPAASVAGAGTGEGGSPPVTVPVAWLDSLAAAEEAFARSAAEKGTREAFLEFLGEGSVIFRPGPVDARTFYRDRPASPWTLTWRPAWVDVAGSGDLGYTTGPWEFRQGALSEPATGWGEYVSIWRKDAEGAWRVALDIGITHGRPPVEAPVWEPPAEAAGAGPGAPLSDLELARVRASLWETEREFGRAASTEGAWRAYRAWAADGVRVLRPRALPLVGVEQAEALLGAPEVKFDSEPASGDVAAAGDLGYMYGRMELRSVEGQAHRADPATFVRIWRRDAEGSWKIVLDLSLPRPVKK